MQYDFVAELRVLIEDIHYGLIPGATIERLQDITGRMEAEQKAAKAVAGAPPAPAVAMSERVANLEACVDATDASNAAIHDRLYSLSIAMREVARKESIHPSVRFLADTIALNLAAPTEADRRE